MGEISIRLVVIMALDFPTAQMHLTLWGNLGLWGFDRYILLSHIIDTGISILRYIPRYMCRI